MVDRRFEGRPTILQNEHRIKFWQLQIRCVCFKRSTTSHWAKLSRKTNDLPGRARRRLCIAREKCCCLLCFHEVRPTRRAACVLPYISYYVEAHNYRGKDSKVHAPVASLQNRDGAHRVLPFRLAKHRARSAVLFGESHAGVKLCATASWLRDCRSLASPPCFVLTARVISRRGRGETGQLRAIKNTTIPSSM